MPSDEDQIDPNKNRDNYRDNLRDKILQNQQQKKYQDVIQKLIRRYIQAKVSEEHEKRVLNENDLSDLKQDLWNFRHQLVHEVENTKKAGNQSGTSRQTSGRSSGSRWIKQRRLSDIYFHSPKRAQSMGEIRSNEAKILDDSESLKESYDSSKFTPEGGSLLKVPGSKDSIIE